MGDSDAFVRDIAHKIAKKLRMSDMNVERLRQMILLQYGQKPLEHAFKVSDYNIHSESTLNATIKDTNVFEKAAANKRRMEELDKRYKDKIESATSLDTLSKVKTQINADFIQRREALLSEKLDITKVLNKYHASKEKTIQNEMSSIEKER